MSDEAPALVLERVSIEDVREAWGVLAARARNVFATWEWASVWWEHFGAGREPAVVACRAVGGDVLALLPLYVWALPGLRIVRLIGHGPADELGPVCAPDHRAAVAIALPRALAEVGGDLLLAEELRRDGGWSSRLDAAVRGVGASPVLRTGGQSWDAFFGAQSSHFRQEARRRERVLERHGLRYRVCDAEEDLARDLDTLFSLHRCRFPGGSEFTRVETFQRRFAEAAFARGWLRLSILELEGTAAAASYGFRFGGVEFGYQMGRDPAWDRVGVGSALVTHTIREAIEDGVDEFRFGRGGEEYKRRFSVDDPGLETLAVPVGLKGRIALAGAELLGGVPTQGD